ncbi:MAG: HDOD domain-containing protein [Pseudomonadota bacterium]
MPPLITLQPVANFDNAWVALLLEGEPTLDGVALERLLKEFGLAEICGTLACVASVDPASVDPALGAELPPGRLILRFPVTMAVDPGRHAMLDALHAAHMSLMATGFPPADAVLPAGVESLAVTCPGQKMPAGFADWLRKLPGPHLALGTTENVCPGFCKFHWISGHLPGQASPVLKGDPTARGLLLRLLSMVATDADSGEIEALIKHDPHLSYQLLKLVNSVAFAPGKHITSFAQAIALLGRRQLQRWLQLLLYARPAGCKTASPLLPRAAMRACLMERLAERVGQPREMHDHAFMVGMFSLLDTLFGSPLADIIAPLHLSDDVVLALTGGGGPLGDLLAVVLASEGAPSAALAEALVHADVERAEWTSAVIAAARWTVQVAGEA